MPLATCEVCGKATNRPFKLVLPDGSHSFDTFTCAVARLVPRCARCGSGGIGYEMNRSSGVYCCLQCGTPDAAYAEPVKVREPLRDLQRNGGAARTTVSAFSR
jgi:hypothetical protein